MHGRTALLYEIARELMHREGFLLLAGSMAGADEEAKARASQSSSAESRSSSSAQEGTYKAWAKVNETPISKSDWSR